MRSEADYVTSRAAGLDKLLNLLYVLLALSVVVSLFGMINTLVLSTFERTRELGMLRAVGMTRRQVRRMVRHESVITALIGAALGLPDRRRACRTRDPRPLRSGTGLQRVHRLSRGVHRRRDRRRRSGSHRTGPASRTPECPGRAALRVSRSEGRPPGRPSLDSSAALRPLDSRLESRRGRLDPASRLPADRGARHHRRLALRSARRHRGHDRLVLPRPLRRAQRVRRRSSTPSAAASSGSRPSAASGPRSSCTCPTRTCSSPVSSRRTAWAS